MTALPTIPSFSAGDYSILKLQQLAYAVDFISDHDNKPFFRINKSGTTAIPSNTWTAPTSGQLMYDNDGQNNPGAQWTPICQTQGIYAFGISGDFLTPNNAVSTKFLFTAGANNPHKTVGSTVSFGYKSELAPSTASTDCVETIDDICPVVLYPGDTVQGNFWVTGGGTITFLQNTSYLQARFNTHMTSRWVEYAT